MNYDHTKIEKKWQELWSRNKVYTTPDSVPGKDNFYLLVEFPYPSGNLHVGHWYSFAVPDILARFTRMSGKNVLYPIGFDAFGLPAENAAIKNNLNPRDWTEKNIAFMTKQIESMGTMFDWSREVKTIDPAYYKWTQWQFLQFYKKGLAYQKETSVNWCPKDKTVLANEQVIDGKCDRCGSDVVQRQMLQWNIKITDYADRLLEDLEPLDWPREIKEAQKNWIGRSEGAEIDFPLNLPQKYKFVILHGFKSAPDRPRWLWAKARLEEMGHEVILPTLPNPDSPTEKEWVGTALAATTYDENTVLVGHSLGAVTALKVLEKLERPIARLVTVGGFISKNFKDNPRPFEKTFSWTFDGEKIRSSVRSITVLHDPRDHAVSDAQAKELSDLLQTPVTVGTSNEPHFTGDTEPDVVMWLRPTIRVFTTRPDTLFGATYLVLSPEHPWVTAALRHTNVLKNTDEVADYVKQAGKKTELERLADQKEKTGVRLEGVDAVNPATGEKIPVYVADYVIATYGTGAIMAVPAHDKRDSDFARTFNIPTVQVVEPVFRRSDGGDAWRENESSKPRTAVMCIVKHWTNDEYLCIRWKDFAQIRTFVSGGIESGEDAVAAGLREIREETGFEHAKFVRHVASGRTQFYHQVKKTNIDAHFEYVYFELTDDAKVAVTEEESSHLEVVWTKRDEVQNFLTIAEKDYVWESFTKGQSFNAENGTLIHSGSYDGMTVAEAKQKMTEAFGRTKKTYKLRDWIVSRQRYWGVPIPVIHCKTCGTTPVPENELPVLLPDVDDYLPSGEGKSPLAKVGSFVNVKCPACGGDAERETDTLDTFVDSSWYFLRYTDAQNASAFAAKDKQDNWMPVDMYSGGAEHTTMHLLYSRFWHKALYDMGLVSEPEPYAHRVNHGLVLGPDGQKMSKSKGNVIDPDEIVERLGADTVRMYLAFMGPYTGGASYPWNPNGVVGVRRFLERVAKAQELVQDAEVPALNFELHKSIKKIGGDISAFKFNTAISQFMILLNTIEKEKGIGKAQWATLVTMLAPFAPHLAEELWSLQGGSNSVHLKTWPIYDEKYLVESTVTVAIQVNGKMRGEVNVPADADKSAVESAAREVVAARLEGQEVIRVVVVPGRLVNFVLKAE
ncbi:class I tRNA ligase family protein [Candidatus Kaiserbacteria bacterium]|nr:class I tRNA ligase family protein [Candidatus Kaiserbacteria bacterium]